MTGPWLASYVALWLLFILMAIVLLGLVRQIGLMQLRLGPESEAMTTIEGLEYGTRGPEFVGQDLADGRQVSLGLLKGRPIILVFFTSTCSACLALVPDLGEFQKLHARRVHTVLVSQSTRTSLVEMARSFKLKIPMVADEGGAISKAYLVRATPYAYRLDAEGVVRRRGIVNSYDDLEGLLRERDPDEVKVSLPK